MHSIISGDSTDYFRFISCTTYFRRIEELQVPLLKSLICLKGYDNGRRFLIISVISYLLLVVLTPILSQYTILVVTLILVTTPILVSSSIRRIRDAGFQSAIATIPLIVYWLNLFGISYLEHGSRWALLILAAITTIAMATISNVRIRHNHHYKMGYEGPISFATEDRLTINRDRIEPTVAGQLNTGEQDDISNASVQDSRNHDNLNQDNRVPNNLVQEVQSNDTIIDPSSQKSWEHQLGLWFKTNQKISIIGFIVIMIFTLLIITLPSFEDEPIVKTENELPEIKMVKSRLNKIEMPDQFWVMLDENNSLTIEWEGDYRTDGTYWSASTGKGDKDCVDLHFNLGENIRTLLVTVKNGGDYYADFSPVDTKLMIESIANKDRFKLCGYEFTLRGTRAILRNNKKYWEYLKIDL